MCSEHRLRVPLLQVLDVPSATVASSATAPAVAAAVASACIPAAVAAVAAAPAATVPTATVAGPSAIVAVAGQCSEASQRLERWRARHLPSQQK